MPAEVISGWVASSERVYSDMMIIISHNQIPPDQPANGTVHQTVPDDHRCSKQWRAHLINITHLIRTKPKAKQSKAPSVSTANQSTSGEAVCIHPRRTAHTHTILHMQHKAAL